MPSAYDRIFEELVNRYRKTLTAAAYHLCDDWDAARDLVQDTLLDAYRSLESLRDQEKAGAWLYTILRRKAAVYRNVRNLETELTCEPAGLPPDDVEAMVRGIVIEQMAKEDREILAGKYLLGLSYQELAETLGINEGAVRVRCFRAKEKLREVLSGAGIQIPQKTKPAHPPKECLSTKNNGGERHDV
jgi:RNA polymerase sigma-70 factor (ECF subfamily)